MQQLCYTFEHWKNSEYFEILNFISEYVTLANFVDTVGDVIHAVSIGSNWIYIEMYKKHSCW